MRIEATVSRDATRIEVHSTGSLLDLPREHVMGIVTRLVGNALAEREGVLSPAPDAPDLVDVLADALACDQYREQAGMPEQPMRPAVLAERPVNLADPNDVRRAALQMLDEGVDHAEICAELRIGDRLLQRWDDEAATGVGVLTDA